MCLSCVVLTPQRIACDETRFGRTPAACVKDFKEQHMTPGIARIDCADLGSAQEPRPRCGDIHPYLISENHGRKSR